MVTIVPAIIPKSYNDLSSHLSRVRHLVTRVQIDVIDGRFGPEASWPFIGPGYESFQRLSKEEEGLPYWETLDFEIDLMVRNPEAIMDDWIAAGAATLIVHVESTDALESIFTRASERGIDIALALKPSTDISVLAPFVDRAAFIQQMGNDKIGYHGVPLDERVVGKITDIKKTYPNATIGIDIGVSVDTIGALHHAGATRFAAGSAVFDAISTKEAIEALQTAAG